jgi:GNAT superfamily N-acetyltransferase
MHASILDALLARFCPSKARERVLELGESPLRGSASEFPGGGHSREWIMFERARFAAAVRFNGHGNNPMSELRLLPFSGADLEAVAAWFDDPETRRWLGDRRWPAMILRLAADLPAEHCGHRVIDRRAWIVAPAHRGRGVARRALRAIATQLAASGVQEVFGGVETDNVVSMRCMEAAGFTRRSQHPDAEGFVYFARQLGETAVEEGRVEEAAGGRGAREANDLD